MTPSSDLEDNGERMIPEAHRPSLVYAEHLTRYRSAQYLVHGKRVLDIASGSGYGSHLLAETAQSVIGVDVSIEAVQYAQALYQRDNLEYRVGDAVRIPLEDGSVDVVVTFETIEHVADYRAFMSEIDRVLAPDGIALISTPNDVEFVEGNHFHLHEFVYDELLELVGAHFSHVDPYFQATWSAVAVGPESLLSSEGPFDTLVLNLAPLPPRSFLYFYLVCSRRPITEVLSPVLALGAHYSDRELQLQEMARGDANRAHEAQTESLRQETKSLRQETESLRQETESLRQELARVTSARDAETRALTAIRSGRSYRLARRLSAIGGRLGLARRL